MKSNVFHSLGRYFHIQGVQLQMKELIMNF